MKPTLKPSRRIEGIFRPENYHTRFIALKFAYLGQRYNGFEHHAKNETPLPTIEEELYHTLNKARLLIPEPTAIGANGDGSKPIQDGSGVSFNGIDYAKCGRTDKGVSAFGQVISLRVRSARPKARIATNTEEDSQSEPLEEPTENSEWDPVVDELPYCAILNRLLPPDIRILAWCPSPPEGFNARFSCRERRYRYYFTQPAVPPTLDSIAHPNTSASSPSAAYLDIDAMRTAARYLVGEHDFRNFCKVDGSKQITNFKRQITFADIQPVEPAPNYMSHAPFSEAAKHDSLHSQAPRLYTLTLHGSAFLWHQVRHIVAILFLIGQGLEKPELVKQLLDVEANPCKPNYDMASDAPLVLWDCIFPDLEAPREEGGILQDELNWVYPGDNEVNKEDTGRGGKWGRDGLVETLWTLWHRRKIDEVLAGSLLDVIARHGKPTAEPARLEREPGSKPKSQVVVDGSDSPSFKGKYVPVLQRPRNDPVETTNARYAARKGEEWTKRWGAEYKKGKLDDDADE